MHPAQPLQSRLFWRIAAGMVGASLITVLAIALTGPGPFGLTVGLVCGGATALIVAYVMSRRLIRAATELTDGILTLGREKLQLPEVDSLGTEFVRLVDALEATDRRLRSRFGEMERHRKSLEQNTTLLQTVFSAMIEGVIVVNTEQEILFANDTARTMLEIRSHEQSGDASGKSPARAPSTTLSTRSSVPVPSSRSSSNCRGRSVPSR